MCKLRVINKELPAVEKHTFDKFQSECGRKRLNPQEMQRLPLRKSAKVIQDLETSVSTD
jgi:hypothetical protein